MSLRSLSRDLQRVLLVTNGTFSAFTTKSKCSNIEMGAFQGADIDPQTTLNFEYLMPGTERTMNTRTFHYRVHRSYFVHQVRLETSRLLKRTSLLRIATIRVLHSITQSIWTLHAFHASALGCVFECTEM